jgi:hypothetical protein
VCGYSVRSVLSLIIRAFPTYESLSAYRPHHTLPQPWHLIQGTLLYRLHWTVLYAAESTKRVTVFVRDRSHPRHLENNVASCTERVTVFVRDRSHPRHLEIDVASSEQQVSVSTFSFRLTSVSSNFQSKVRCLVPCLLRLFFVDCFSF